MLKVLRVSALLLFLLDLTPTWRDRGTEPRHQVVKLDQVVERRQALKGDSLFGK